MNAELAIKDVAERTGIAAGTIRMWEQRYGFPAPERTASGYRRYSDVDVEALRRIAAYRRAGLSIPAAIDRVRDTAPADEPLSMYAAVRALDEAARPQVLRKRTLEAVSKAIEHETLASATSPVIFAAFQRERFYRPVAHRYERMARQARAATVFAEFGRLQRDEAGIVEVPIDPDAAIGNEWAVVVDAPGYAACLLAWEQPARETPADGDRRFEAIWTIDPRAVRRAGQVAARLAGQVDAAYGAELEHALESSPLALETPAPALTALTNRAIGYLDQR